jgi:hypothetical protein
MANGSLINYAREACVLINDPFIAFFEGGSAKIDYVLPTVFTKPRMDADKRGWEFIYTKFERV